MAVFCFKADRLEQAALTIKPILFIALHVLIFPVIFI